MTISLTCRDLRFLLDGWIFAKKKTSSYVQGCDEREEQAYFSLLDLDSADVVLLMSSVFVHLMFVFCTVALFVLCVTPGAGICDRVLPKSG